MPPGDRLAYDLTALRAGLRRLGLVRGDAFDVDVGGIDAREVGDQLAHGVADGLGLLRQLDQHGHRIPVLMITGYPTIRTALHALRLGAVDYLTKPFTHKELLGPVNRVLRRRDLSWSTAASPVPENRCWMTRLHVRPQVSSPQGP